MFEKFSNGPLIDVSVTKPWVLVYEIYFWILNISYVSPKQKVCKKLQNDHWPGCLNLELSGALHTSDYWKKMFFGNVQYLISSLPEWETPQCSEFKIEIRIYTMDIPYLMFRLLPALEISGWQNLVKTNWSKKLWVLFNICHHVLPVRLCFLFSLCVDGNLIITPPLSSLFDVDLLRKQEPRIAKKSYFSIYLAQEQAGVGLMWYARVSDVGEGIHCLRYIKAQSMAFQAKLWFCKANITSTYPEVVRLSPGRWSQLDSVTAPLFVFL